MGCGACYMCREARLQALLFAKFSNLCHKLLTVSYVFSSALGVDQCAADRQLPPSRIGKLSGHGVVKAYGTHVAAAVGCAWSFGPATSSTWQSEGIMSTISAATSRRKGSCLYSGQAATMNQLCPELTHELRHMTLQGLMLAYFINYQQNTAPPLPTEAFTHREVFTQRGFYIQKLLH